MRELGITKVQLGIQNLDDKILELNQRGHTVQTALEAAALLRGSGFKIVAHWMPNLLGATPESDREDFPRLWLETNGGLGICPDELKIYPTQLLEGTTLYKHWQSGEYHPYSTEELIHLIADLKTTIPEYCRVNRIIRDIPAHHIIAGNRRSSLRQDILKEMEERGQSCRCIRCREIRGRRVDAEELSFKDLCYHPAFAEEHFLSFETADGGLAGYLRLSLPTRQPAQILMNDLQEAALIREVHVYGQSLPVGSDQVGAAQHSGLGTRLLVEAENIAHKAGFSRLAVIAAVGTRPYYYERGFTEGELYMVKQL
jgi:elongator complex protein 3